MIVSIPDLCILLTFNLCQVFRMMNDLIPSYSTVPATVAIILPIT